MYYSEFDLLQFGNKLKTDRPRDRQQARAGPCGFVVCPQGGVVASGEAMFQSMSKNRRHPAKV